MRTLALLVAVLSFSVPSAWSCGGGVSKPAGMISDEGRVGGLVEKILAAKAAWAEASAARGEETMAREREWGRRNEAARAELTARFGRDAYKTPEWREMAEKFSFDARMKFVYDEAPSRVVFPERQVREEAMLCGSTTLEDGHRINAGSYWVFRRMPAVGWTVPGVEMHYLLEHHQATPGLIEKLESFFAETPR